VLPLLDHLFKLDEVLRRIRQAGLKINVKKSSLAKGELEHLRHWVTLKGIQPMPKKVDAMMRLEEPKTRKQLRGFVGMVNYYRDMWKHRSHVLAPLASLTSTSIPWKWGKRVQEGVKLSYFILLFLHYNPELPGRRLKGCFTKFRYNLRLSRMPHVRVL
jgi:hypothetical protein